MKFIELMQPPQSENSPIQKFEVSVEKIDVVFKEPLQPVFMVGINGLAIPCIGDYNAVTEELKDNGFTEFSTVAGGSVMLKPSSILFFNSVEIGVYNVMVEGKTGVALKTTREELDKFLNDASSIII